MTIPNGSFKVETGIQKDEDLNTQEYRSDYSGSTVKKNDFLQGVRIKAIKRNDYLVFGNDQPWIISGYFRRIKF